MRRKNTELLGEVIRQYLKQKKLDRPLLEKRLIDAWPEVLGKNIIKYTTNLNIRNKTLYVSLNSSVLRHDLFLSKESIIRSLNSYAGAEVINDIIFK